MISDYLSKEERYACVKAGAFAYAGMLDAEEGPLPQVKEAQVLDVADTGISVADKSISTAKSLAMLAAISAGIPLGVFGHVIGRRIFGMCLKVEELKEKIRLYRTAADEMASGLSGGEV